MSLQTNSIGALKAHFLCEWWAKAPSPTTLDQETVKWSFRSSSQAATCYCLSNHSRV